MSVINTNLPTAVGTRHLSQSQEALGRSLNRLSSAAQPLKSEENAAGLRDSRKVEALSLRLSVKSTGIQNAVSHVQTADRFLHGITQALSRLGELATLNSAGAKGGSDATPYGPEFKTLQDQLRDTIGGTAAEIGGTADVASPRASFNGNPLFGAASLGTVAIDTAGATGEPIDFPDTNLRNGAMLKLIQQDARGNYLVTAADGDASSVVSEAAEGVATRRAALLAAGTRLEYAGAMLRVEAGNLGAAVAGIADVGGAEAATKLARFNISAESATALQAQANQSPNRVLTVLQN